MTPLPTKIAPSTVIAFVFAAALGTVQAQDAAAGKAAFAQCSACHSIDGKSGVGPSLKGVFGRPAGSEPGFRFSRAIMASGMKWDMDSLDAFLTSPKTSVLGNAMPFSGIFDATQRADLISYLQTLN